MNYLVQRGKVRGQVIHVPEGLPELLSDITREVLRCQPTTECLCQFIIDYLHSVIVTREKARTAKNIIDQALRVVDDIIADMCICDIGKMKADHMAAAMEECFKRFLEHQRCEHRKEKEIIRFGEEDMLDELIARCKFTEHDLKISRPLIEDAYNRFVDAYMKAAEDTQGTEALYMYFKERELKRAEEMKKNTAAVKIQALYRGYVVRRSMFVDKKIDDPPAKHEPEEWQLHEAASKIQRFFRHIHEMSHHDYSKGDETYVHEEVCEPASQTLIAVTKNLPEQEVEIVKKSSPVEMAHTTPPETMPVEIKSEPESEPTKTSAPETTEEAAEAEGYETAPRE